MTTFLLIRHAAFDGIGRIIKGRAPGVRLNPAGQSQAASLAVRIADAGIVAVYSSPLERAMETAAPIAGRVGVPVVTMDAFAELDWGLWTGRAVEQLRGDPEFERFNRLRGSTRIPGGELMLEAQARAVHAIEEIRLTEPANGAVAVVTHADIVRAVLCQYLGMPLDHLLRLEVDAASVSVLEITAEHVSVPFINLVADFSRHFPLRSA